MTNPTGAAHPAVLRTALLVLLAERESHGYDLGPRLVELGVVPDMGGVYRTLRSMDGRGELRSTWDVSSHGPARRVYALTDEGRRMLQRALTAMEEHRTTINRVLLRSRRRWPPSGVAAGQP